MLRITCFSSLLIASFNKFLNIASQILRLQEARLRRIDYAEKTCMIETTTNLINFAQFKIDTRHIKTNVKNYEYICIMLFTKKEMGSGYKNTWYDTL